MNSFPRWSPLPLSLLLFIALLSACSSVATTPESGADAGLPALSSGPPDAGGNGDRDGFGANEPVPEKRPVDAAYVFAGGELRAERFVTKVVSFVPGPCSGFGSGAMPDVVFGPPRGAGEQQGGYDVVSLGSGGEIVVGFDDAIVDGPGDDFVVFENAFFAGGNSTRPAADLGEVSVSDDGTAWKTFACTATTYPYGACAGWHPVIASYEPRGDSMLPTAAEAGGDRFDLATVGLAKARLVRIRDMRSSECTPGLPVVNLGFDLDAIVSLNAERP